MCLEEIVICAYLYAHTPKIGNPPPTDAKIDGRRKYQVSGHPANDNTKYPAAVRVSDRQHTNYGVEKVY